MQNMKRAIIFISTLIVEFAVTYAFSQLFSIRFIEIMFFSGVMFTLIVIFFTSSGGAARNYYNTQTTTATGIILKWEQFKLHPSFALIASIIFTVIGLVFFILLISGHIPPA